MVINLLLTILANSRQCRLSLRPSGDGWTHALGGPGTPTGAVILSAPQNDRRAPTGYRNRSSSTAGSGLDMVIFCSENSAGPSSLTAQPVNDSAATTTMTRRCRGVIVVPSPFGWQRCDDTTGTSIARLRHTYASGQICGQSHRPSFVIYLMGVSIDFRTGCVHETSVREANHRPGHVRERVRFEYPRCMV